MLRRTCVQKIEQFNFGQPALSKEFKLGKAAKSLNISPATAKNDGVKVSKLANGTRVITHNAEGPMTNVGAYIEAGPKFDPASAPGLSYAMRWALMTGNLEDSLFQIDACLRATGTSYTHTEVRKQFVGLRLQSRMDQWTKPFDHVITSLSAPRFAESDIERFRDTWDNLVEEQRWQYPREYVIDQLEQTAFWKEPLGSSRAMNKINNDESTHAAMLKQWTELYHPERVVIAGVNVAHNDLVAAYENAPFPHSGEAPHFRDTKTPKFDFKNEGQQFNAGAEKHEFERRAKVMGTKPYMEEEVIAAVGYKVGGRDNVKDFATAKVVQALIGAATNDGLRYDRESTAHGVRAFYNAYQSAGLIGFTTRAAPGGITASIIETHKAIQKLDAGAIEGAKARATVAFYNEELEAANDYLDFLGTSLKDATHIAAENYTEAIAKVSAADVKKAVEGMMAQKPSLYATGDLLEFPSLRQLGL